MLWLYIYQQKIFRWIGSSCQKSMIKQGYLLKLVQVSQKSSNFHVISGYKINMGKICALVRKMISPVKKYLIQWSVLLFL